MINTNPQIDESKIILSKQIKRHFIKDDFDYQQPTLELIRKCFDYLDLLTDSPKNESCTSLAYDDILSYIKIIYRELKNLPSDCNYHDTDFFRILINTYSLIPDDKTVIKIQIFSIFELMITTSPEASKSFIDCNIDALLQPILSKSQNISLKSQAISLMKNILLDNDEIIIQYYIDNNYIELFISEYKSLSSNPELGINNEVDSLLLSVASFLTSFTLFPELVPEKLYYSIFETITDIFRKRNQYSILGVVVYDVLKCLLSIFRRIDLSILIKTGFINQIYEILNEENFIYTYASCSFFLLGSLVAENYELAKEIVPNSNYIEICCKKINENDINDSTLEGFFFFLTNLIHIQEYPVLDSLIEINLFNWCFSIYKDICYLAQKSICYFILAAFYFASDDFLSELISNNNLVDFIFEIISVSRKKLIVRALHCFITIFKKISLFSTKFPYFLDQIIKFLNNYDPDNIENEEDKAMIVELLDTLQKDINSCTTS